MIIDLMTKVRTSGQKGDHSKKIQGPRLGTIVQDVNQHRKITEDQ